MHRRKTDKPTEKELELRAENIRLGARILELERAAAIDAAHLQGCFENREAERGIAAQVQRDYDALRRASIEFLGKALTVKRDNTPEWMAYMVEAANEYFVVLNRPERAYLDGDYIRFRRE